MANMAPEGMIDEHAPRNQTSGNATYTPSPEEKKTIKMVDRIFERAKKHRGLYDGKWLDYYHMFRGKQWKELRPSYRHTEVINLVFRAIQSAVPLQLDTRPKFEFLPEEPSDLELANILNEISESDWTRNNWGEQLLEIIYDANFYGTGLSQVVVKEINKELKITYESVDPFYCFPDPDARDCNKECSFFIHAEPVDIRKLKKKYPDKAEWIKPDVIDLMRGSKTDFVPMKFRSPVDSKIQVEGSNTRDMIDKDKCLVITAWLAPEFCEDQYEETENAVVDPESGQKTTEYVQTNPYPRGRKVVVANGVLLEDGDAGYDDSQLPFQRYSNYILPREFWGISEVEQLEGPQKTFNKLVSFALDVMTLMGNPIWLVHGSNGIDPENLINRPGLIVEWDGDPGTRPVREEGVQLQPYVMQMIEKMAQFFNDVSGSQDVSRGVQPTGVTAFKAINALQEAAQTRIRQKARNLDFYLQQVGQQYASRVFQFKSSPEIYRLTNDQGVTKFFKFHVEDYEKTAAQSSIDPTTGELKVEHVPSGEMGRRATYQPMGPNGVQADQLKIYEVRGKFDVRVSTGSALPFAKEEKEQKLLQLFSAGIIDAIEVLKGSDYPNWQGVIDRMQQKANAAAQAQQSQPAPQGPPAAPPPAPAA